MGNKTLFIAALHGDEGFGVEVLKKVEGKFSKDEYNYDWIIGNPKAWENNVRFTEVDLNRVAPGSLNSEVYEERRAAELIELSEQYSSVIDIHGTNANSGIFILIPNPTIVNLMLATSMPIENVVIWAAKVSKVTGPVTQYLKCPSLEIECGPKSSLEIHDQLTEIVSKIVASKEANLETLLKNAEKQKFFKVYGSIEDVDTSKMKEFEETDLNGEKFYPLLINSYKSGSARKMQKIDFFDIFSY